MNKLRSNYKYKILNHDENEQNIEMEILTIKNDYSSCGEIRQEEVLQCSTARLCLSPFMGYILAFVSCLFFATGSMFSRLCVGSLNASQITLVRSFVQLFFCIAIITYKRLDVWYSFPKVSRTILCLRGAIGGISLTLMYYAFQHLPLGNASAIMLSSPVHVVFLAWIVLKEHFGLIEGIVLTTNIIGVLLIAKPTFIFSIQKQCNSSAYNCSVSTATEALQNQPENLTSATIAAILASFTIACVAIAIRKLPKVHYTIQIFYLSVASVIVSSLRLIVLNTFPIPFEIKYYGFALMVGLCGICGQVGYTKALQKENAGPVSVIRQSDIVFAYIYQVVVFNDPLEVLSVLGAFIIISGSVVIGIKKWLKSKRITR